MHVCVYLATNSVHACEIISTQKLKQEKGKIRQCTLLINKNAWGGGGLSKSNFSRKH